VESSSLQPSAAGSSRISLTVAGRELGSLTPFEIDIDGYPADIPEMADVSLGADALRLSLTAASLKINWVAKPLGTYPVWECVVEITNESTEPINLTRLDSLAIHLGTDIWEITGFASAWGDEFRALTATTLHDSFFGVRSGRSGHGQDPLIYAVRESDQIAVAISPAWSGNWHIDVSAGGWVRAGISTWNLEVPIAPGETLRAPSVVLAAGASIGQVRRNLQSAIREHWMARSVGADQIPVEWNHWWPYEDAEVTEEVILDNAALASELGFETAVVDAGWFGESKLDTDWTKLRGDWDLVNLARFPSGLERLGEGIIAKGLQPGIWVEAEAVGADSRLRREHPEVLARDDSTPRPDPSFRRGTVSLDSSDPGFLGYVCLGSEAGYRHTLESISNTVRVMRARWLKLDFNIDPGRGCTRTDHGHSAGDGLFRHYIGLYRLLDEVRERHPDLLVESCSSGGLRIDLGLARHVHCFFLSDPDYTEHHLQVLWGVAHLLPPLAILHWPWSWWRGDYPPSRLDWPNLEPEQFDLMLRAAMLHRLGMSYPLPRLSPALRKRIEKHVRLYKERVRPLLAGAELNPLTASPNRGGRGERSSVWQLSAEMVGVGTVSIVAGFQLDGQHDLTDFAISDLISDADYFVFDFDSEQSSTVRGGDINPEFVAKTFAKRRSWMIEIRPA
jgi:alpha-galactosidase